MLHCRLVVGTFEAQRLTLDRRSQEPIRNCSLVILASCDSLLSLVWHLGALSLRTFLPYVYPWLVFYCRLCLISV